MRFTRFLTPCCVALVVTGAPTAAIAAGGAGIPGGSTPTKKASATGRRAGKKAAATGDTTTTTPTTTTTAAPVNGGAGLGAPVEPPSTPAHPTVPGDTAQIIDGVAYAPSYAPDAVKRAIWAGNDIRTRPYVLGGGHASFISAGYDCSGSVSYVLHAAGLLSTPEDSGELESWGAKGLGQWITVYTNPAHAFVEIAGIRFDTSAEDDPDPPPGSGPRWRPLMSGTTGFLARHPALY